MQYKTSYRKRSFFLIVICIMNSLFSIGANSEYKKSSLLSDFDSTKIKLIKNRQTFTFPVSKNPSDFGYYVFPGTGEIFSVSSIRLIDNAIYLTDASNSNIKKIDLNTGKLSVSKSLKRDRSWLISLGYLNNQLYLITNWNIVYIMDLDLNYKRSILLKNFVGRIFLSFESLDSLVLTNKDDGGNDKEGYDCPINYIIDKYDHCVRDSTRPENFDLLIDRFSGIFAPEVTIKKKLFLNIHDILYEIPVSIENVNSYDCYNVDFSKGRLTYYEMNKNRIKIEVLDY